jgi:prepilin-type N-terminal cleavage/methylation domain-containing protein
MKKIGNQRGFTLIELLVVLVIIGILTAIAVTRYQDLTTEAQIGATKGNLATIRGGISLLHARFLLAGYGGTAQEWPSVAELNNNISAGRVPAALNGLKIIEGPSNPTCATCMPPDSVIANNRLVSAVTTAQADARTVVSGPGIGWDYDPVSGQVYVAALAPPDSLGNAANLW